MGSDRVRCSIFKMADDVSGRGPMSFRGELPVPWPPCLAVPWPPMPPCLPIEYALEELRPPLAKEMELVVEEGVEEDDAVLGMLLLFLASDWWRTKDGFGICLTEALAGDLATMRLLEAGRFVMDTVLVLLEPSFTSPGTETPLPAAADEGVEELLVAAAAAADVLGSLVMVTSGVGDEMVGVMALDTALILLLLDDGDLVMSDVLLVPEVECAVVLWARPLVSGVCGAALEVGDRSMGAGSDGRGSVSDTMLARLNSRMRAAAWLSVIRLVMAATSFSVEGSPYADAMYAAAASAGDTKPPPTVPV